MKFLFPLLESEFKGDKRLMSVARKLYRGFEGSPLNSALPYVEVSTTGVEATDAFDLHIDKYSVDFNVFAKGPLTKSIDDIVFELRRVFKDNVGMESSAMSIGGFESEGVVGPSLVDAHWEATLSFMVYVVWKQQVPLEKV